MQSFDGTLYLFMDDMARMPDSRELGILNSLRPKVHIMITSRHEIGRIRKIDLTELDQDPAIKMFYGYYEYDKEAKYRDDARIIVESVNRHTLLVELLAKAVKQSFDTLDVFRKKLEAKGFFDVSQDKLDVGEDNTTIEDCVRKLYDISGLSNEQQRIISLFTIFTPEKEIYGRVAEWAGLDRNAVNDLVKLGWLARTKEGFVIHQIVRDSLARQVGDNLKLEEYGDLIKSVADTDAYLPRNLEYTKIRERLVLAEGVARNLEGRTMRLLDIGEYQEKDKLVLASSAVLFNNMAGVYREQGEYEKALEYYGRALVIVERELGGDHSNIAITYNNMAVVYRDQREYEKALEYYGRALVIVERELGGDHSNIAITYNNMGMVYEDQGEHEKALEYYGKALIVFEEVLGTEHPSTATTYNNMAGVYHSQGEYEKALEYCGKALAIQEQVLGAEHPEIARAYNNMAMVYRAQRKYEKALEYYGKALIVFEEVLGTEHPETAITYNNMGKVYEDRGEYEKALKLYEKAISVFIVKLGEDHPYTQHTGLSVMIMKKLVELEISK